MNDLVANKSKLPAHVRAKQPSNLSGDLVGAGFNKLTFKGNRFRVKVGGDERVLGGTSVPVVILEANPNVSRVYYGTAWDAESATRPDCASEDGVVPLPSVDEPQSSKCMTCPQNEKGSALTDTGGKTRACSFFKRVAVLLVDEPELGPLVADMKAMSLFGDSKPDKGHFSLRDYAKRLDQNKVASFGVVTTLHFDDDESVPKVLFQATDYTDSKFHKEFVEPLLESGELENLVTTGDINTGEEETKAPVDGGGGFRDKLIESDKPDHADSDEDEDELTPQQKAAITRKKNAKKKKKKEEKKAAEEAKAKAEEGEEEDEDDEEEDDDLDGLDPDLAAVLDEFE